MMTFALVDSITHHHSNQYDKLLIHTDDFIRITYAVVEEERESTDGNIEVI